MGGSDWDAYWRNARSAAAHADGGPQDAVLAAFWTELFERLFPRLRQEAAHLDLACGNGAVPRFALSSCGVVAGARALHICGLDESPAALQEMRRRDPSLTGVAAAASCLPFGPQVFDLVTSQFGMEYAGPGVVEEACRVLKPGGTLAAVLHLHGGGIYRECRNNLQAIDGFRQSRLLEHFESLFRAVVGRGGSDGGAVEARDRQFAAAVGEAERVFGQWGTGVASGTLHRIYSDLGHMYRRLRAYDRDELIHWIDVMRGELETYSGRMSAMLSAALDEQAFDAVLARVGELGLLVRIRDTLAFGQQSRPSAWLFVAEKSSV